jgi:hypothetical protein
MNLTETKVHYEVLEKGIRKFPWVQVSYRNNIKDLINKARTTDMLIARKPEC